MHLPTTISLNSYYHKKSMVFKQNPLLGHQIGIRSLKKKVKKKDVNNISETRNMNSMTLKFRLVIRIRQMPCTKSKPKLKCVRFKLHIPETWQTNTEFVD